MSFIELNNYTINHVIYHYHYIMITELRLGQGAETWVGMGKGELDKLVYAAKGLVDHTELGLT